MSYTIPNEYNTYSFEILEHYIILFRVREIQYVLHYNCVQVKVDSCQQYQRQNTITSN